jgi:hypothetical protein
MIDYILVGASKEHQHSVILPLMLLMRSGLVRPNAPASESRSSSTIAIASSGTTRFIGRKTPPPGIMRTPSVLRRRKSSLFRCECGHNINARTHTRFQIVSGKLQKFDNLTETPC